MVAVQIEQRVSDWQRSWVRIGEKLKQAREALRPDLSLREFAKLVGVTASALSKIESGDTKEPSYETIARAAAELGITLDELQRGTVTDQAAVSPAVLGHYARARFRAWRREGLRLHEIARRSGLDVGQVRRIWGGGPIGEASARAFAAGLKMRDQAELAAAVREWWRATGRALTSVVRPDEDPVEARATANADARSLVKAIDEDVLDALEVNANRDSEPHNFWYAAFLEAHTRRNRAENADEVALETQERERKKSAAERETATAEAAERLTQARAARGETPEPPETAPKSSRSKHRKAAG